MALNADVLGALMRSKVDALSIDDLKGRDALFKALSEAVIEHIQTAGVVTVTTVTPGVQSGPSAAPGTGTGTIS